MLKEVFKVTSSALPDNARVAGFRGTEAISRPYEFNVFVILNHGGAEIDLADVVGAKGTLTLDRENGHAPFVFHGIFAAFEHLHEFGDRALFRAVLVPQLWLLTQTFHSRIWTHTSIPDIIKEVLEDSGLSHTDFDLRLVQTYKPQEHVCQYMESNLDFIHRWMEREGMYYFFEQGHDSEKLVITDDKGKHYALDDKPVRFFPLGGHDGSSGEALHMFTCKHHALPASVKLRDYDYAKPTLDVSGEAPVSKVGIGEISVYGHRFFTPDDGKRLAKLRTEELLARQVVYRGAGTQFHLRPGHTFALVDHPRPAFDTKYLATQVEHTGNEQITSAEMKELTGIDADRVYWVEVTAIPAKTQFRAVRGTPWPRIYGFENGVVCGPADTDYAQIDDSGRYNVKFKFDESDLKDGKASTFVRMMQPHGGNPEGFHFPLRKGTEVVFSFLGGDPDRPVISGVVPNLLNPSLVSTKNHTQNVLQTGGMNHMIIEDLAGVQHVDLYSPTQSTTVFMGGPRVHAFTQPPTEKSGSSSTFASVKCTLLLHTDGSGGLDVGQAWYENVGASYWKYVGGTATVEYVGIHTLNCDADSNEFYNAHQNIQVATGRTDKVVAGGMTHDIHGGLTQTIEPGGSSVVTGGWKHEVTETSTDKYKNWETTVDELWHAHMGEVKWTIDKDVTVECNKWECTQKGAVDWKNLGDISWSHLANEHKLTVGLTTEVIVGAKAEALVGGKAEMCVGLKSEITVAAQLEVNMGPACKKKTIHLVDDDIEVTKAEAAIKKIEAEINKHDIKINSIMMSIWS